MTSRVCMSGTPPVHLLLIMLETTRPVQSPALPVVKNLSTSDYSRASTCRFFHRHGLSSWCRYTGTSSAPPQGIWLGRMSPNFQTLSCRRRAALPSASRPESQLLLESGSAAQVHALGAARHTLPFVSFPSPHHRLPATCAIRFQRN
jgi:hypothetical protein